jgi:glycosyltransferase involved in cell wall biosynthesis
MRILLLTQYFPPEFGAAAARNSEHAALWAKAGHEVEVLTAFPNYPSGEIAPEYRGRRYAREEIDGYVLHRTWILAAPNRSFLQRALASASFLCSALLCGLLKCSRPDAVVASSGPFFVGPLGYLLALLKRAPFVLEVRDILPQQAVDVGLLRNPMLIRLLECIEAYLYRRAAAIVTVAPASREALVARGFDAEKIWTVENGVGPLFHEDAPASAQRPEWGELNDLFLAVYVGAHGVSQGLRVLLDCAALMREHPEIAFVLVGEGAEKAALQAEAARRGLDNVRFLPTVDKTAMPEVYAAADLCFVPLRQGPYFTINIPSKLFEIMACGRPVVLGAHGQARTLLQAAGAGIAVEPEDAADYARAVQRLYADAALRREMGARGRAYVLAHFTRAQKAAEYLEILEGVADHG